MLTKLLGTAIRGRSGVKAAGPARALAGLGDPAPLQLLAVSRASISDSASTKDKAAALSAA